MTELALFASTFALVFALGFQSLNVNGGHYWAAFMTSFLIGGSNMVLFKLAPQANATETVAFMLGGPFGIITSMWTHKRTIGKRKPPKPKTDVGTSTCKQSRPCGQCSPTGQATNTQSSAYQSAQPKKSTSN